MDIGVSPSMRFFGVATSRLRLPSVAILWPVDHPAKKVYSTAEELECLLDLAEAHAQTAGVLMDVWGSRPQMRSIRCPKFASMSRTPLR